MLYLTHWLPCCHETRMYTCSCMLLILIKASHSREQWLCIVIPSIHLLFDTATVKNIVCSKIDSWPRNSLYDPTIRKWGSVCNVGGWLFTSLGQSPSLSTNKASLWPRRTFQTIIVPLTFQWQRWKNKRSSCGVILDWFEGHVYRELNP